VASPIQITVNQLSRLVGTPSAPTIIDVRIDEDFNDDPHLIPGALRHPFTHIAALAPMLRNKSAVVYCQKGFKISEGAAAILRSHGVKAEVLEGGQFGWRDAGQLMVQAHQIPERNSEGQSVWVTRLRPKIDRIACPWLIRRFVDPKAQFLFVGASEVLAVAEKFNATPFDIEDVYWSPRDEQCSFDTMLNEFGLNNDALEQLDAGMLLYDAMYRWARDATGERHDWPTNASNA